MKREKIKIIVRCRENISQFVSMEMVSRYSETSEIRTSINPGISSAQNNWNKSGWKKQPHNSEEKISFTKMVSGFTRVHCWNIAQVIKPTKPTSQCSMYVCVCFWRTSVGQYVCVCRWRTLICLGRNRLLESDSSNKINISKYRQVPLRRSLSGLTKRGLNCELGLAVWTKYNEKLVGLYNRWTF